MNESHNRWFIRAFWWNNIYQWSCCRYWIYIGRRMHSHGREATQSFIVCANRRLVQLQWVVVSQTNSSCKPNVQDGCVGTNSREERDVPMFPHWRDRRRILELHLVRPTRVKGTALNLKPHIRSVWIITQGENRIKQSIIHASTLPLAICTKSPSAPFLSTVTELGMNATLRVILTSRSMVGCASAFWLHESAKVGISATPKIFPRALTWREWQDRFLFWLQKAKNSSKNGFFFHWRFVFAILY